MKVDYTKYPNIPEGCSTNYNKRRKVYQVYRDNWVYDEEKGKKVNKRITFGQIKDGVFTFGKLYLARKENEELVAKLMEKDKATKRAEANGKAVADHVGKLAQESELDQRQQSKVSYPIEPIALSALISALAGNTDCNSICQLHADNKAFFDQLYPDAKDHKLSHDLVYRALLKVEAKRFNAFYDRIISPLIKPAQKRVLAADGQAVKATYVNDSYSKKKKSYMLMSFYDVASRVCRLHQVIDSKTNEITVGPAMLQDLDIRDAIITADAMNCQYGFVKAIREGGADYCLCVKDNQKKALKELRNCFATTHSDQIATFSDPGDLAHGRVESRSVSVIKGSLLSIEMKEKWQDLSDGAVIRVRRTRTQKTTGKTSIEEHFYISSLPATENTAKEFGEIIRAHWAIENKLHWALDINFLQDRTQASDPTYISNRSSLNKLALAMLEHYRYWLWELGKTADLLSIKATMLRCRQRDCAIECIACSQGLI